MPKKVKLSIMTVRRVDRSPLNEQRWCLTPLKLRTCKVWVTCKTKPQRMKMACTVCPTVA